ncbi:unnamed protein product, partial [Rhizoctonia solani]
TNKKEFLYDVRHNHGQDWNIVMGNEGGDLDSCATAIAMSYISTKLNDSPSIALIQTPRSDLKLRKENLYGFHLFGDLKSDHTDLLTIEDITDLIPLSELRTTFTLVDHNSLLPKFAHNGDDRVTAIFDHHEDEGKHPNADPRIICTTGSCASVVTDYYKDQFPPKPDGLALRVASLLLSAIALDTKGLKPVDLNINIDDPERGNAYPKDNAAHKLLRPLSVFGVQAFSPDRRPSLPDISMKYLYEVLYKAKQDVGHLSGQELLRRDYKGYQLSSGSGDIRYRLSTVPISVHQWIERDGAEAFWADQAQWINEHNLTFSGILTSFRTSDKKPKHERELILVFPSPASQLEKKLYRGIISNHELDAKRMYNVKGICKQRARAWRLSKKASRKLVAPAIKEIIEGDRSDVGFICALIGWFRAYFS